MAKVLTEQEVESIGQSGNTIVANRCCTKARAETLNCVVSSPSGAANNQLVTEVKGIIPIPIPIGVSRAYNGSAATATFPATTGASITKYRYSTNNSSWTETTSNPSLTTVGTLYTLAYYSASSNYTGSNWSSSATITITRASTTAPTLTAGGTTTYTGTTYYAKAASASSNPAGKIYYGPSSGATNYNITASTTAANLSSMGRANVGTTTIYAFFRPNDTTNYSDSSVASTTVTITNKAAITVPTPTSWTGEYDGNNHTATFGSVTGASITKYRRSTDDKTWTELTYNGGQTDPGKIYVLAYYTPDSNHSGGGWSSSAKVEITGYKYVDLGLPSGTKWATQAVGSYYMYGKGTTKWKKGQTPYSGTENPLSESLDTAKLVWGGSWRMPTKTQCEELINNTTKTVASGGIKFTATNGNSITIPLNGYHEVNQDNLINNNTMFEVWTRTPYNSTQAYSLYGIVSGSTVRSVTVDTGNKSDGYTVWAVKLE